MTAAFDLFNRIKSGGCALVSTIIAEEWTESPILDFKLASKNSGPMVDDDRRSLAKEVSAFANSDGGVILWGVYAASAGPLEADVARTAKPIDNVIRFLADLQRHTGVLVSPAVSGVEHVILRDPCTPSRGFVLTYVPRSEGEPHMAMAKDQHCYYFRSGSSSLKMEPFMISDRYKRRPQPKLEFVWHATWDGTSDGFALGLVIGIRNVGLGLALYPAIVVHKVEYLGLGLHGIDSGSRYGLQVRSTLHDNSIRMFAGGVNDVIHPGTRIDVAKFRRVTKAKDLSEVPELVTLRYQLHCDGWSSSGSVAIDLRSEFEALVS